MSPPADAAGRDQFVQAIKDLGRDSLSRVVETVLEVEVPDWKAGATTSLRFFVCGFREVFHRLLR